MTISWWGQLSPAEATVECSGEQHRLRWADGALSAMSHDDPEGERVLGALGGTSVPCISLLEQWERHADDLRVLVLGSRGRTDVLSIANLPPFGGGAGHPAWQQGPNVGGAPQLLPRISPTTPRPIISRFGSPTGSARIITQAGAAAGPLPPRPFAPGQTQPADGLTALLPLGPPLWDRLTATVVAHWAERLDANDQRCEQAGPTLEAALFGRATAAVRSWLGDPGVGVQVDMLDAGGEPSLSRDGAKIRLQLPFSWLRDIWVADLAVVLGRFSLALVEAEYGRQRALTVSTSFDDLKTVTVSID